jgi:hypothetical protein
MNKRYVAIFCLVLVVSAAAVGALWTGSPATTESTVTLVTADDASRATERSADEPTAVESGVIAHDTKAAAALGDLRALETEIKALGYVERMNSGEATAEERARFAAVAEELTRLRAQKMALEIAELQAQIREQIQNVSQE